LYASPHIIRKEGETCGACSTHGAIRNAYKFFVEKPERKRRHGRPRHRWEVNIRMNLREIGWEDVD